MKKILVVHGWNYKFYNNQNKNDPWFERKEFITLLKQEFEITIVKLPGFCGVDEPKNVTFWSTKDYGMWLAIYIKSSNLQPDFILGYSFGAPVSLFAVLQTNLRIPLILISPAFLRADSRKSKIAHIFSFLPKFVRSPLHNWYLNLVNPYFKYGTHFLRESYKKVVRENSISMLEQVAKNNNVTCIYGEVDTATPYELVQNSLNGLNIDVHIIRDGGHNIAKTHPYQIFEIIKNLTNEI